MFEPQSSPNTEQHYGDRSGEERRFQGLPLVPEDEQGHGQQTDNGGPQLIISKHAEEFGKRRFEIRLRE